MIELESLSDSRCAYCRRESDGSQSLEGREMPAVRTSVRRSTRVSHAVAAAVAGLAACSFCAAADLTQCAKATAPALLANAMSSTAEAAAKVASPAGPTARVPGTAAPGAAGAEAEAAAALALSSGPVPEVAVEAPEPKYVAPTLRDRIGRIWAPVLIDGKGPFRLVLDTGASHSAVTAAVAQALGMPLCASHVLLRGVLGTVNVPAIHVSNLIVGDLQINSTVLPIVPDALGGAQGVLGTEELLDKRIYIDFRHDLITIKRSHGQRAEYGFVTVPVRVLPDHLLATTAYVGSIRATAIIDTGAQTSIANRALREALLGRRKHYAFTKDELIDTTDTAEQGQGANVPPIRLGSIRISSAHITIGDNISIFSAWNLADKPALLIGMDALGTVDVLVIDYRRGELQIRPRDSNLTPLMDEDHFGGFMGQR